MPALPKNSLIDAIEVLLKEVNASISRTTIVNTLLYHPDYPSLIAVANSLSLWKIDNYPVKLASEELSRVQTPFIAHLKNNQLAVVTKIEAHQVSYYYEKPVQEATEDFLNRWSGISILVSPSSSIEEPDFLLSYWKDKLHQLRLPILGLVTASALIYIWATLSQTLLMLLFGTKLFGIVLCWMLTDKLKSKSKIIESLCEISSKTSCKEVITSSAAQLFGFIGLSDIGLVYFIGGLLALCVGTSTSRVSEVATVMKIMSLASVFLVIFSVYYQATIIKKWCVLCLGVMALLSIDIISFLLFDHGLLLGKVGILPVVIVFGSLAVAASGWSILKQYQDFALEGDTYKARYARLKNNPRVFQALLTSSVAMQPFPVGPFDLRLGTPKAALQVTVVLSPYCVPCKVMFKNLVRLLDETDNQIKISIRFSTFSLNTEDAKNKAILLFAMLYQQMSEQEFIGALEFWYEVMDLDIFTNRYAGFITYALPVNLFLEDSVKWAHDANITHTPTVFVGERRLPHHYSINDLRYFTV